MVGESCIRLGLTCLGYDHSPKKRSSSSTLSQGPEQIRPAMHRYWNPTRRVGLEKVPRLPELGLSTGQRQDSPKPNLTAISPLSFHVSFFPLHLPPLVGHTAPRSMQNQKLPQPIEPPVSTVTNIAPRGPTPEFPGPLQRRVNQHVCVAGRRKS